MEITIGQGLALIGFWLPLLGAFIGSTTSNIGVTLAVKIGAIGTLIVILSVVL